MKPAFGKKAFGVVSEAGTASFLVSVGTSETLVVAIHAGEFSIGRARRDPADPHDPVIGVGLALRRALRGLGLPEHTRTIIKRAFYQVAPEWRAVKKPKIKADRVEDLTPEEKFMALARSAVEAWRDNREDRCARILTRAAELLPNMPTER